MSNLRQNSKNSSDFNLGNQKKKKKKKKGEPNIILDTGI